VPRNTSVKERSRRLARRRRLPARGRYGAGVVNALSRAAVEDYLKVIFNLAEWDSEDAVSNADVAARVGVSTSSASEMVRKLTADGLLEHERYGGIALTAAGRPISRATQL